MPAAPEAWAPPEATGPETQPPAGWAPPEAAEQPAGPTPAANATFDRRMDALYSGGLDNLHKLLSDRQQSDLNDLLQRSDNPGEMKAQMVNRAYLAHNYPDMAPIMDDNWGPVKKAFAKSALGIDKPEVTDSELFAGIKGLYAQRKVLQDTAAEMGSKIVEAAYQGNEDWRTLVPKVAKPEQQAQLDEYAARVNNTVKDQAHLLSPHVVKIAGLMEQFRNGGDQSLLPQMVDEISHLDPQQRETVVSMAAMKVQKEMGEADHSATAPEAGLGETGQFIGAVGQRLGRGVASMVQGARSMAANLTVGQTDGQGENPYALDKNREDTRTQLLQAYNAIADPVEGKNLASKVALGLASFAPQMAAIAVAPHVGLPLVFAESQNERASTLMSQGVPRGEAFAMATPQALVDALSQMVSTNIVFKGALAPLEQTAARSMGEVATRTLKVAGAEAVTLGGITAAQQFMPAAMQDWGHKLDAAIPEIQWADSPDGKTKGMLHQLGDALPETALSVAALMLLGSGRAGLAETSKFADSLGHVDALKAAGYTDDQANKIADQATPQGRLAVLQSMKPEAVNTKGQADAIAKLDAENKAAAQDRSAIVSKSDDGKTFTVTDAGGKRLGSATTEDAANDIKAQYDQSQTAVSRGMKQLSDSIGGEEVNGEMASGGAEPAAEPAKTGGKPVAKPENTPEPADLKHIIGSAQDVWADKTLDQQAKLPSEEQQFTPETQSALAVKGAALLDSGVTDFDPWSHEMLGAHGDAIEPRLREIYDEAKTLHVEQSERGASQAAKDAMEETWNGEQPAGGARAAPNDKGTWTVTDKDGKEVGTADTPEAAVELVHQTNQADSASATDALNDMIAYFKERGTRGAVEQTGEKRTVHDKVKAGEMTTKQAKDLVKLYADLGILEPGTTPGQARIYGENARVYNAKTQLYDYVTRLHDGADPLVLIEEKTEEYFKQQLDNGVFTLADAEKWRSELEGKPVTPNANEGMREREATEWFSQHAQAYMTGKAEAGNSPLPLSVRRWLDKVKEMFAKTFALARDLMDREAAGKLPEDFQKHLARSVGLDEGFLERRAREEETTTAKQGARESYTAKEALHAIGLPTPKTDLTGMGGELSNLYESLKFNERMTLFGRKRVGDAGQFENAKGLDEIAQRLREDYGFSWVKGPDDVIKLAEDAFLHGKDAVSDTSMALRKDTDEISGAALKLPDGSIETGPSHADIISRLQDRGINSTQEMVDGFVTKSGKFVSPEEAFSIARKSGQINPTKDDLQTIKDYPEKAALASEMMTDGKGNSTFALRKPKGDKTADMFDSGLAGEDFTLAGEKAEDHAGATDAEEARREAQKKADAAQGNFTLEEKAQASDYAASHDIPEDKRGAAAEDIASIVKAAKDPQLDLFDYKQSESVATAPEKAESLPAGSWPTAAHLAVLTDPTRVAIENARAAFENNDRVSSIIPKLVRDPKMGWDIRGAVIKNAQDFLPLVRMVRSPYAETTKVVFLNASGKVLHSEIMAIGSATSALMHPNMLARTLALHSEGKKVSVIISHNHPSGDPAPSAADVQVTRQFNQFAREAGIHLLDHIITNGNKYYSFREAGMMDASGKGAITRAGGKEQGADMQHVRGPGAKADWETISRDDLPVMNRPEVMTAAFNQLKQVDPNAGWLFYLNRKNKLLGIEKSPDMHEALDGSPSLDALKERIMLGVGREGATAFLVGMPDSLGGASAIRLVRQLREFAKAADADFLDAHSKTAFTNGSNSARESGVLEDQTPYAVVRADRKEYDRLQEEMKKMGYDKVGTPEFNALWHKSEEIKNRHGGMPPGETAGGSTYALRQAPFYSRLTRTVEETKQEKASGDQWKAMIRNSKLGVNKGEYDLVGVDDLESGKTYTKQEVLDYLKANQVKVEDVTLGAGEDEAKKLNNDLTLKMAVDLPQKAMAAGMSQLDAANLPAKLADGRTEIADLPESLRADAQKFLTAHEEWTANNEKPAPKPTHFSQYTLPGADEGSYREVLLTVPDQSLGEPTHGNIEQLANGKYRVSAPGLQDVLYDSFDEATKETQRLGKVFPHLADRSLSKLPPGFKMEDMGEGVYPRFIINGPSTVGSPRYASGSTKEAAMARFTQLHRTVWKDGHSQYDSVSNPIVRLRTNERTTADGKKMLFLEEVQAPQKREFEKMPELFQKNWREIGFKYALRKAVESGMDAIGWTTGDQQAERYDLSKHLDMVRIGPSRDYEPDQKIYHVSGYKNGSMIMNQGDIHEQQLADYVGKDLAAKASQDNAHAGTKEYSGLDLKVGGEGLRKLYDQDFRNVVNGLPAVRKSGQKVGMAYFDGSGGKGLANDNLAKGAAVGAVPVHALTITPEMRAAVEGGQPTFALRPHGLPEVGQQAKLPGELDQAAKEEQIRANRENQRIAGLTKFAPFREALNRFVGANQLTSLRVEREVKRIMSEVPDASRRVAITNYLQANGDLAVLKEHAQESKPAYRKGYEDAMKLTPQEKSVAASIGQFYKDMLVNLQKHEVDNSGVENYVNQMWKQEVLGDLKNPGANSRLMTDLRNAKERVFGSYFEGEQAGKVPVTKDIAHLMAIYATEAGKVVASRRFLKDLTTKKAPDGRALAAVQGQIQDGENLGVETGDKSEGPTFIKANAHPEGYKTIDNPAFQGWKFLGKKNGEDVMMKGQMALHPDIFRHVQNVFGESAIDRMLRPNEANGPLLGLAKVVGRGALKLQTFAKGTTLGFLSPFHQVQEGTHAIGHHVNPFWGSPDHLLDPDNPLTRHAVDHGLMIAGDGQAMQMFKDSIDSNLVHAIPQLAGKIPKIGEALQKAGESQLSPVTWSKDYAHYLFHSYIPRLKMKTFLSIEANNLDRYKGELKAGTVTKADVAYLSAKQTNNAYGHLNWQDIGVDPTLLHFARIALLAPDFLAARTAFAGEAIKGAVGKKSGREQLAAFMTLAATQYITARILNKFSDDDYHLADHPFSVVHDGREYTMRSVPEDLYKLVKQPEQFVKGRISPGVNMLQEALFQRNFRGEKVDYTDEAKDMVSMFIPITLRANPLYRQYLETGGKSTVSWWQQLAGAAGIHISRNSPIAETYKLAADFKKGLSDEHKKKFNVVEDKGVYPTSKYQQLRYALEDGDMAKAMKEYEKLKEEHPKQLSEHFHESVFHPFTGSKHLDAKFAKEILEEQKVMLDLAKHSREQIWRAFKAVESGDVGLAGNAQP